MLRTPWGPRSVRGRSSSFSRSAPRPNISAGPSRRQVRGPQRALRAVPWHPLSLAVGRSVVNGAVFEVPAGDPQPLTVVDVRPIAPDTPDVLEALDLLRLHWA